MAKGPRLRGVAKGGLDWIVRDVPKGLLEIVDVTHITIKVIVLPETSGSI